MNWSDHLCQARFELLEGDGDERQRLRHAAEEFRAALSARATWPPEMKCRADALETRLLSTDPEAKIARMDEETLRRVSDDLWRFCETAEPCPWDGAAAGVRGVEHLREARLLLHQREGDAKDRLRAAAHRLRAALFHIETWPEGLRSAAESLSAKLFHCGEKRPEEAVRRMGDKTAGEISLDILRLCDDADREDSESHSPPDTSSSHSKNART